MPDQQFPIGRRISVPGHFAEPVVLVSVRPLAVHEELSGLTTGTGRFSVLPADSLLDPPHRELSDSHSAFLAVGSNASALSIIAST